MYKEPLFLEFVSWVAWKSPCSHVSFKTNQKIQAPKIQFLSRKTSLQIQTPKRTVQHPSKPTNITNSSLLPSFRRHSSTTTNSFVMEEEAAATAKPRPSSKKKLYNGKMRLRRKPLADITHLCNIYNASLPSHLPITSATPNPNSRKRKAIAVREEEVQVVTCGSSSNSNSKSPRMDFRWSTLPLSLCLMQITINILFCSSYRKIKMKCKFTWINTLFFSPLFVAISQVSGTKISFWNSIFAPL